MHQPEQSSETPSRRAPGMREFIAMAAALMASNALAIDSMLPALPAIGTELGVAEDNQRQLVVTAYLLGFGAATIAYGPLADRFGRRRLLLASLLLYSLFALAAGLAMSFTALLAARAMQGVAAAGSRVLVMAVIRDRYQGWEMARVMSFVTIVFMVVPMLAPFFGQAVVAVASWRYIFIGLALYGVILVVWSGLRLPETLARADQLPLSAAHLGAAAMTVLRTRASIGNTLAVTFVMGGMFAFIGSIEQIMADVFHRPELMPVAFAVIALPMMASGYVNSRFVERIGSRRILLSAITAFAATSLLHWGIAGWIGEKVWSFVLLQGLTQAAFGLVGANASALAMAPLGHIAGTASSVQGVITTIGGALIGLAIGQQFDGTTLPFLAGLTLCGAAALVAAWWANKAAPGSEEPGLEKTI